jgi:formate hydrogenlyase subunit 6/NADH:ubiquinone oxidoreductase subunit I
MAPAYFKDIGLAFQSLSTGLWLTLQHFWQARKSKKTTDITKPGYFDGQRGIATIQFPHERIPVPDVGRYQLHNEMDDCIVCDKCAKICPVNCITIEPIKSSGEFGKTSDGTPKRIYAATFDIDMGKCCFCGLCTTVCPTECLTMTKSYDYSVADMKEHNFEFGNLSLVEILQKKKEWETHQASRATETTPSATPTEAKPATSVGLKPVFKPKIKPQG